MNLKSDLLKLNHQLSKNGMKLKIEQRGSTLNLRGPLPSREEKDKLKNQRIALGLNADTLGLEKAQKLLELVELQIKHDQFSWKYWNKKEKTKAFEKNNSTILDAIENFEKNFFNDPGRQHFIAGTKTTWISSYKPYLTRLKQISDKKNINLSTDLFSKTLESYSQNSRSRQQCATAIGAFARYINIQLPKEWRIQASGYGLHNAQFRDLPNDNQIKDTWKSIPNERWKLAFGLMATYGLRNHEIFFCDLSTLSRTGDKVLRVLPNTKTGEHQTWPFHPEWVETFELERLSESCKHLPKVNTNLSQTTLQQVGRRVAEQFRRYKLPLTPYDLRHSWAIRTIHIGLPDTVAARMMGHSVSIHTKTYHHWITRRDQQKAVDAALSRNP